MVDRGGDGCRRVHGRGRGRGGVAFGLCFLQQELLQALRPGQRGARGAWSRGKGEEGRRHGRVCDRETGGYVRPVLMCLRARGRDFPIQAEMCTHIYD